MKPLTFTDDSGCVFDGRYRYSLWRRWDLQRDTIHYCCLNPGTSGATDDPAVTRLIERTKILGYGGFILTHAFGFVSSNFGTILFLLARNKDGLGVDPVGPRNDAFVADAVANSFLTVCAWGPQAESADRQNTLLKLIPADKRFCLGTDRQYPRHPNFVTNAQKLVPFYQTTKEK